MAIESVILDLFRQLRSKFGDNPVKVLSAGYPDLLVDEKTIGKLFGEDVRQKLKFREDGDAIARWHNMGAGQLPRVIESEHFFGLLGCELDVIDVAKLRGNEIIADLNYPLDRSLLSEYEILIDSGTCEHVFNAGQALINLASLVKPGGYIIQAAPFNSYNHGFYNFSPTLFHDFYSEENGYQLVFMKGFSNLVSAPLQFDVPPVQRFNTAPENAVLIAVAQRVTAREIRPVVQHKYKGMIG